MGTFCELYWLAFRAEMCNRINFGRLRLRLRLQNPKNSRIRLRIRLLHFFWKKSITITITYSIANRLVIDFFYYFQFEKNVRKFDKTKYFVFLYYINWICHFKMYTHENNLKFYVHSMLWKRVSLIIIIQHEYPLWKKISSLFLFELICLFSFL